jgi:hypothetical protein
MLFRLLWGRGRSLETSLLWTYLASQQPCRLPPLHSTTSEREDTPYQLIHAVLKVLINQDPSAHRWTGEALALSYQTAESEASNFPTVKYCQAYFFRDQQ